MESVIYKLSKWMEIELLLVFYLLFLFTFGVIFQSSKSWKDILPYLLLMALGCILLVLLITMIVLTCFKFIIDLIEFISDFYNSFEDPLEGM